MSQDMNYNTTLYNPSFDDKEMMAKIFIMITILYKFHKGLQLGLVKIGYNSYLYE